MSHGSWWFDCRRELSHFRRAQGGKDVWSHRSRVVRNLQIGRMEAGKVHLQHRGEIHNMHKRLCDGSDGCIGPCAGDEEEELAEVLGETPCFTEL